ncbi:MAG: Dabb family protein, partial [Desulfococcaceae bacterium]
VSAFDDMAAMKRYQEHPDHQNALTVIREICSDIRAVDYAVESGDA